MISDINNATSGTITGSSSTAGNIVNYGTINVSGFNIQGVTNEQGASFTNNNGTSNSNFDNAGTANLNSGMVIGNVTNQSTGNLTTSATIAGSIDNYGTLELTGMGMVQGNVTNHSGTLTLSGQYSNIFGTLNAVGGTFTVIAGNINALSGSANGTLKSTLLINRANNAVYSGSMSGNGAISIVSGTQTISGANTYTGNTSVSSNGQLILTGSLAGALSNTSNASHPSLIASGAKVRGNIINTGGLVVNGTIGGLTVNTKQGTIKIFKNAVLNLGVINSGTINMSGASTIKQDVTNTSGATFNLTDSSEIQRQVNNAGTFIINTNAKVSGNFTNSTVLNMDSGTISGALSNTGVMTIQDGSQVGSIENKSGTATLSSSTVLGAVANDANGTLTMTGGSAASATNAGIMTLGKNNKISGNVTNTAGTLTLDGNTINGILAANGGSFSVTANGASLGALSGTANGTLNGQLALASTDNTYSGILSGSGGVTIAAAGQQVFNGANSYTGTTEVDGGTLVVNGDQSTADGHVLVGNTGNLSGTGTLGGATTIAQGGTLTPGDVSTRVGTLSITNSLALAQGSSQQFYMGQTNASGGAYNSLMAVGGDLTLGGTLNITANPDGPSVSKGHLDAGLYRLYTYGGTLSGVADQTLGTTNVATGGTVSLQTSIAHQINLIVDYNSLTFWDGGKTSNRSNSTVDGGSGTWNTDPKGLNWTDKTGTTNGAWANNNFVVYAGNAGTVTVQDTLNGQQSNVITSGMQFANNDGKIYTITGDNLYAANSTTTVRVGDGTTAGASITAILDTVLNDKSVSGGTTLVKSDMGTLIITKDQTYTGGTTIAGGVLQLGNGGTTGALAAGTAIQNNGRLAINHSGTFTLAQNIAGTGGLEQNGAGTTVLSGTNTYTGDTTVTQGTLEVDGSIASSRTTTVQNGGVLSGTGTVGNTVITQGGTLAPQGVQGNMTVQGTLQADSNSTLALSGGSQLSGKTMTLQGVQYQQLQSGTVTVTDSAALSGNVVLNVAPSTRFKLNDYYTLLTTGSGFTQKSYALQTNLTSLYTFISPSLFYNGNDLDVLLARNAVRFVSVANSRNEHEAAQALDHMPADNAMVQAAELLTPEEARRGMNALSGEVHASARTALIQDSLFVRQAAMDRLDTAECGNGHVDATLHTASLKTGRKDEGCLAGQAVLWGQAYGSLGHNGGDGNAASMHHSTTGFIMGVDAPFMDGAWRIGALLSYGRSMFDINSGRGSSGHGNNVSIGGYAGTHWGAFNLKLGAAYTWNMLSMQRNVAFPGYADRLSSNYLAGTAQGFGEVGYRLHTRYGLAEPFANVAYVNLHTNGYHEHGGAAALQGRSMDTGVTFSTFGIKASSTLHAGKMLLIPHASLAYRHAFGLSTPTAHTLFAAGGSGSMDIAGVPLSVDSAVIDAGLTARLSERIKIGLSYLGQYGNQSVESGVKASVLLKF
ncbi:autotransporter domain-containing protein [Acetobacter okinawensis]|uniref:autotransporter domain-containing protein n=1 Tax=Acetobacter okinawensis TaxID=1076594 RepID=UPI0015D950A5|nr:autotransporter domain-containing protein [Acetobacter okinawensis]